MQSSLKGHKNSQVQTMSLIWWFINRQGLAAEQCWE